ncbi:MAG: aminoglycoside phosphotransferase family protein [Patescibacteria group bacterium]
MLEQRLFLDGISFELLGEQRSGAAVYRGEGAYLRIGEKSAIARDLLQHRLMEEAQYPVAGIISEGELGHRGYFIEKSLGTRSFRAAFQEDCDEHSRISHANFNDFLHVIKKLHGAQLKSRAAGWNVQDFAAGVNVTKLSSELPAYREAVEGRFMQAVEQLKRLPGALQHGDCNAANTYRGGIIDLEDSFFGPVGYDAVSALMSIEWSPETRDHEFYAQYRFTPEQRATYLKTLSVLNAKVKAPPLSTHFDDLAYCRAIWLCSGMHAWPRLQQWRFEKLIREYLL